MLTAAKDPELMATDLVEYLVVKGMPFREAHESVAQLVQHARELNSPLPNLDLSIYRQFAPLFAEDLFDCFDPEKSLAAKNSPGSTGFGAVKEALSQAKQWLASH
jgi:argininosuccinate lyase